MEDPFWSVSALVVVLWSPDSLRQVLEPWFNENNFYDDVLLLYQQWQVAQAIIILFLVYVVDDLIIRNNTIVAFPNEPVNK